MDSTKMTNAELHRLVVLLTARVDRLESPLKVATINKVETHHAPEEGLNMGHNDMIQSMVNTLKILNPKLIDPVTHRHSLQNVRAITGCKVLTEKMMDEAYVLLKKG
jgi:hypothetical protein